MAYAYPIALRRKMLERYKKGGITQLELCEIFGVHLSSFKRWLQRERKGEDLLPRTITNDKKPKIDTRGLKTIKTIIQNNPCITLRELSEIYYKKHKVKAGTSVFFRACKKLNLRRKKLSKYSSQKDRTDVKKKNKLS